MAAAAPKRLKVEETQALSAFLQQANSEYEAVHKAFEDEFWGTKMALKGHSAEDLSRTKEAMETFLASSSTLAEVRRWMATGLGTADEQKTLLILERTLLCYIMESDEAKGARKEGTVRTDKLEAARNTMKLGYLDSAGGALVEKSSVGLRTLMGTSEDEAMRKAAYEGLRSIGPFICENGFVEVVKLRNKMAKGLGYADYYDYKVTSAEGFGKDRLFTLLDTLEKGTRGLAVTAREGLRADKGAAALQPWNTSFALAGDVTKKLDPYFPFAAAVERWGRSFAAMGIQYRGASMTLDLLDRKDKYSNGFCHWPQPAWRKADGTWQPSSTNFTSLADPCAVGSGYTALTTLMHEAGHAAHFANVDQPSPLFSQERAPTSVAYAENQSMFLDSLVGDAAWRGRYAVSATGEVLPFALHAEEKRAKHPYEVFGLRAMLAVPYFEKALYEMPDEELTAARIAALADETETRIIGGPGMRPLLSVPHIISDEASCYYHGYVLAEMGVHQFRDHFLSKFGQIVDNKEVGRVLAETVWSPGNSKPFLDIVKDLTGEDLSGRAWTSSLEEDVEVLLKAEHTEYERAVATAASGGAGAKEVELHMHIKIVDGDEEIADSEAGGFLAACATFSTYVGRRFHGEKEAPRL